MKRVINFLKQLWHFDPIKKYVDAGIVDFSGQGRNRYGR